MGNITAMRKCMLFVGLLVPFIGYAQCKALRKKKDRSTGTLTITTDPKEPVSMTKQIDNTTTVYYLTLSAPASAASDRAGVFLTVADKTLFKWPDQAVSVTSARHRPWWNSPMTATSTINLTAEQIQILATNRISDYELSEFDWAIKEDLAERFRQQVDCLVKADPKKGKKRKE